MSRNGKSGIDNLTLESSNDSIMRSESTRSVSQPANGASNTVLQYPIVTEPRTRRTSSVKKPISLPRHHRKADSLSATLKRATKEFLGLEDNEDREFLWTERRIRLANRRYGGVDPEAVAKTLPRTRRVVDSPDGGTSAPPTFPRSFLNKYE